MSNDEELEYSDEFVGGLEVMFGEGFLSPGGQEEIALVLEGIDVAGKEVLDIGCGIGGPACCLVEDHGAARVVGIDVEQPVLDKAAAEVGRRGLSDHIELCLVEPGPLAFEDASFDLVFSKDAIIHVPDKATLFREARRVLRPGGWAVLSDWFRGDRTFSKEMETWLESVGLTFEMATLNDTAALLAESGFSEVTTRDRNSWYLPIARDEVARMGGADRNRFVEILGEAETQAWIDTTKLKVAAVEQGHLRPGHLRGRKPV